MEEKLIRREIPIQGIQEYEKSGVDDLTATVPVHLDIFKLPERIRTDKSLISGARETVKEWYNKDMTYHLECLEAWGDDSSLVMGFEKFDENWVLEGVPNREGFLTLNWKNNNSVNYISFCPTPVVLYNLLDEKGRFYNSESLLERKLIESFGRDLLDPETVWMDPEKMKKYGVEGELAKIDLNKGIAEVMGHAFCSQYQPNMGKALLLRDFAVFYLNNLLDETKKGLFDS